MKKFLALFLSVGLSAFTAAVPGSAVCILNPAATVFAEGPYQINSAQWDESDNGHVFAIWDETDEDTKFIVNVYKSGGMKDGKVKTENISTSKYKVDCSTIIAKNGTGDYIFSVYPVNGGTDEMVYSEVLTVESDYLDEIRTAINYHEESSHSVSDKALNIGVPLGWGQDPGKNWFYRIDEKTLAKNRWLEINGKWYYFGPDTIMVKGWQKIGGRYYFFNQEGDLWVNTDVWGRDYGTPDTSRITDETKAHNLDASTESIDSLSVSFSEEEAAPGVVRPMTIKVPSSVQIKDIKYSAQTSNWSAGVKVTVDLTLETVGNRMFGAGLTVHESNATWKEQSKNQFIRTFRFEYTPKYRLAKPDRIWLDGDVLRWKKVGNAPRYEVKVAYLSDDEKNEFTRLDRLMLIDETGTDQWFNDYSKTFTVNGNSFDLSEYLDVDDVSGVAAEVRSVAKSGETDYYLTSEPYLFTPDEDEVESTDGSGTLSRNASGTLYYLDSSGKAIQGWQEINGCWYWFDWKGRAAGPGWKEIKGTWFFFDNDNRMVSGWIQVGSDWYFLENRADNADGRVVGAMATGNVTIDGVTYHLNDDKTNGKPLGVLIPR